MACLPLSRRTLGSLILNRAEWQCRQFSTCRFLKSSSKNDEFNDETQLVAKEPNPKEILMKEFPDHFHRGKFNTNLGYVEFIDEALAKMKDLGLERNREAYKELFKIFPAGAFHAPDKMMPTKGQYIPQQLAATRILHQMSMNRVRIDKDFERLTVSIFSVNSEVWNKVARTNYWHLKLRNIDKYPVPEELPKEPHKLAKIGIERMLDDERSVITTTNTSNLPDSVDRTWIVSAQSPSQKAIIDKLDDKSVLYIEEGGLTWVGRDALSYYVLKYYVDSEIVKQRTTPPEPDFDMNTIEMKFYGKPIRDKIRDQEEQHYADGAYILGVGITGTSSQDSLSSWLKLLQKRNPKLGRLNVVFRTHHQPPDLVELKPSADDSEQQRQQQQDRAGE